MRKSWRTGTRLSTPGSPMRCVLRKAARACSMPDAASARSSPAWHPVDSRRTAWTCPARTLTGLVNVRAGHVHAVRLESTGCQAGDDLADAASGIEHARAAFRRTQRIGEPGVESLVPVRQDFRISFVAANGVQMAHERGEFRTGEDHAQFLPGGLARGSFDCGLRL